MTTLGQNITHLRAKNGWSQDELAAKLEVSRQSVSKWETNASVPELDKLLKLAELFGATLDELVRGGNAVSETTIPEVPTPVVPKRHTTAGVVLLCTGMVVFFLFLLLGGGLMSLLVALPFWTPALICFTVKRHTGLWCAWVVFLSVDLYLRYATGLNWTTVRLSLIWEKEWNYMRLFIAWVQFAGMAAMVVCTLHAYRSKIVEITAHLALWLIGGWVIYLAVMPLTARFLLSPLQGKLPEIGMGRTLWFFLDTAYSYLHLALLTVLLHYTFAMLRVWRRRKRPTQA